MKSLAAVEAQIEEAMRYASSIGFTFAPGAFWWPERKRCCALGAVDLGPERTLRSIERRLGIDRATLDAISRGFDADVGSLRVHRAGADSPLKLGARLRLLSGKLNAEGGDR